MIPVARKPEPRGFDSSVRQPGLSAIDELVGRPPRLPHRGRRRKVVAPTESQIPANKFPALWRKALGDMLNLYDRRCAYLAMYLEHGTGNPTVDHYTPRSRVWNLVYEWDNFRLCAATVNAKKSARTDVVDPFKVKVGWFELNLTNYSVRRGSAAPNSRHKRINATLPILNIRDCCKAREEYIRLYRLGPGNGGIDLQFLEARAPFIARELRRQAQLVRGDV